MHPRCYPLSPLMAETIISYLKNVRPISKYMRVFLSMKTPHTPLGPASITHIVSRRWKQLNVVLEHYGSHSLRHACATYLINEGISIKEISDHLGHRSIETTRIYTKVDLVNLRKVANFDLKDFACI